MYASAFWTVWICILNTRRLESRYQKKLDKLHERVYIFWENIKTIYSRLVNMNTLGSIFIFHHRIITDWIFYSFLLLCLDAVNLQNLRFLGWCSNICIFAWNGTGCFSRCGTVVCSVLGWVILAFHLCFICIFLML